MSDVPFQDTTRIDARDKVRGKALFGADDARPDMVHAALAVATIGKGRIVSLDTRAAAAVSGVRLVLTHRDLGDVKSAGFLMAGGYGFQSLQPMLSPAIAYRGQPIALVAADSLEPSIYRFILRYSLRDQLYQEPVLQRRVRLAVYVNVGSSSKPCDLKEEKAEPGLDWDR